jgi:hypothetical protein
MKRPPFSSAVKEGMTGERLSHPLLTPYPPSERRAILSLQLSLGSQGDSVPSLSETIDRWESGDGCQWRREKMRRDMAEQLLQIERHRYFLGIEGQCDIKEEFAARDWIAKHAGPWRDWWEQQPQACPDLDVFGENHFEKP